MLNGSIKVQIKGVQLNTFESKKGIQCFTFEVIEPVTKFVSYTNNSEKGQLADLAENGEIVDLDLILKNGRFYFLSASPSDSA